MKKKTITIILGILIVAISPICFSSGREKNLSVNGEVTAKIRAFDREFFKEFDVDSAGVREYPTALHFDPKDDYHL